MFTGIWLFRSAGCGSHEGFSCFSRSLGHLFAGRPVRGGAHFIGGTPIAIGGFALALLGFNTQTYERLTHEGPVAEITVKLLNKQQNLYAVTVHRLDGPPGTFANLHASGRQLGH